MGFSAELCATTLTATILASSAAAETVLTFNNFLPVTHGQTVDVFVPWAEKVAEVTEGRVRVNLLPSTLAAPPRMFDLVESGGADIAWGVPAYTPGRFTLTQALDLPFLGDSAEKLSVAYWQVHEEIFEAADEFDGVKVLAVYTTGPGTIYTTGSPPRTFEEFAGKKFRVGGEMPLRVAEALGAAAVSAPSSEVPEMLSRNIVDGAFFTHEAYESYKLADVIKGQFIIPGGAYNSAVYIIMNQDKWDALSKEDQEAIWSVSGEALARIGGQAWDKADANSVGLMEENGVERFTAEGAMLDEIRSRLRVLEDEWIKLAADQNVDGAAALSRLRELSMAE